MDKDVLKRLKNVHYSMMSRCYKEVPPVMKTMNFWGNNGWESWHDFWNFCKRRTDIKGWDENRYVIDKLSLDKDSKIGGNKVYSKGTCVFLTPEENNKVKPNQQHKIVGYSPEEVILFQNASEFAPEPWFKCFRHTQMLHTNQQHHRQWQFCMQDEYYDGYFKPYGWTKLLRGYVT